MLAFVATGDTFLPVLVLMPVPVGIVVVAFCRGHPAARATRVPGVAVDLALGVEIAGASLLARQSNTIDDDPCSQSFVEGFRTLFAERGDEGSKA